MIKNLFETKTPHHHIKIIEDPPLRKMLFGSGLCQEQSAINLKSPGEHVYDYSRLSLYSLFFIPKPTDILVVGLGGAVIPNQFSILFPEANIDILELDSEVVELSKKYFNFKESDKVKAHIGDAFVTISKLEKKYDIIILDVFTKSYIPHHIMSMEFLVKVNWMLKENGVVVINTCNDHPSFSSHLNTMLHSFPSSLFYRADGPNNNLTSIIFIAKGCPPTDKLEKLVINEKILNSKIFTVKAV